MSNLMRALAVLVAAATTCALGPSPEIVPPNAVRLTSGDSIQRAVDANPEGTPFFLAAGVYRLQQVVPKTGNSFIGAVGAVLNGAVPVTAFVRAGRLYVSSPHPAMPGTVRHGQCTPEHPRCDRPNALFFDDRPLRAVASAGEVAADSWFADDAGRVFLAVNPAGHKVELAMAPFAFGGDARNVTVANLVIEKYASGNQKGAVNSEGKGTGWIVRSNEIRWNFGYGVAFGSGGWVIGNLVHHNGQLGVGGGEVTDLLLQGNKIAFNSWNGVDCDWECGGAKWGHVRRLVVRDNDVHDNQGIGLWTDVNTSDVLIERNRVARNLRAGISHEISGRAVIRDNLLIGNGATRFNWGWHAQIQVQNSAEVEVFGNRVALDPARGGNGITIIQQDRGPAHGSRGVFVHDNDVVMAGGQGVVAGRFVDFDRAGFEARGNRFDLNRYHLSTAAPREAWADRQTAGFTAWQAAGQDGRGSVNIAAEAPR